MSNITPLRSSAIVALLALTAASTASAQVTYSTAGASYTQDFSSLTWGAAEDTAAWTNNSTLTGWSVTSGASTTQTRSAWSGSQASGNLPGADAANYFKVLQTLTSGTQAGGDRVWDGDNRLGFRTGATPSNSFATLQLTNTTGGTLDTFTIGYEAAQYFAREGGAIDVRYSFDNSTWTTINGGGTTTGSANLRYNAPVTSAGANLNLNTTQITDSYTSLGATVTGLAWNDSQSLYVQFAFWRDIPGGTTGNSPVLSIDDVSFTATAAIPEPSAFAALAGLGALGLVATRRRRV